MKRLTLIVAGLLPFSALLVPSATAETSLPASGPCSAIAAPAVPDAQVLSLTRAISGTPAHCDVTTTLTHPGVGDRVTVQVWLPLTGWNGRFEATGGGGFSAGFSLQLAPEVAKGYAAATTDAGVNSDPLDPSKWALDAQGQVNQGLLTDFASRSLHDMTVVGKAVTNSFYGRPANYSYWNGCSTGGRQGLMEAQQYPTDFDGILAASPAINWDRFITAELWPQVVMNQERAFPTACEFSAFNDAAIKACDPQDGVRDGVIGSPEDCRFDPRTLVGRRIVCAGKTVTIRPADADVVQRIWDGPRTRAGQPLWYGLVKGAPFTGSPTIGGLADTTSSADGRASGMPFPIAENWIKYFLKKQPSFNTATITYDQFDRLFEQSRAEYHQVIGTDDPDLSQFAGAGGKMITWHGLADPLIFPQGTIDYRKRVEQAAGSAANANQFYRLFLAPGVGHCMGGTGPVPTDPMTALVSWVERGKAPETLPAATTAADGTPITRDLCRYPLISRYTGHGDPHSAENYRCVRA